MRSAINLLLISCCALTASAREEFKRDFSRTIGVAAGRTVRIEHTNGRVSVHTHASNEAQVRASVRCSAPTADQARACAERVQITVQETGGGVSVKTEYPNMNNQRDISYAADLDITMPQ